MQKIQTYHQKMDALRLNEAYEALFSYISKANKYIEDSKPWVLAKDETKQNELKSVMNHLANCLRQSAILLSPALVETPAKLFEQLGLSGELTEYKSVTSFDKLGGQHVVKKDALFPRLDANVEIEYIKNLMQNN